MSDAEKEWILERILELLDSLIQNSEDPKAAEIRKLLELLQV